MKLDRKRLIDTLVHCKRGLTSKGNIPVLGAYCFTGSTVFAYDGTVVMMAAYDELPGFVGALPGEALRQWLELVPGDDVTVEIEKSSTLWKAGRRRMKLESLPHSEFALREIPLREIPQAQQWVELDEHFLDYLRVASTSLGTDAEHDWRLGVTFHFVDDSTIRILSSDNVTVACVRADYEVPEELHGSSVVIPPQAVAAVLSVRDTPSHVGFCQAWTHFVYEDGRVILARIPSGADVARFDNILANADWETVFAPVSEGLEQSLSEMCKVAKTTDLVRAQFTAAKGELSIHSTDGIVTIEDATTFEGHPDREVCANPMLLDRAIGYVDEIALTSHVVLLKSENVNVMVSTLAG